ncbi:MAG: hypothetical protein HYX88_04555 [Chloroflexi bacterium]|nr:hypothetical protein [Chloroflexota bacterium]
MQLPKAAQAQVDPEKITDYLLSVRHPDGRPKAEFFTKFGFRRQEWQVLRAALRTHGATQRVANVVQSPYGIRYIIEGRLETPDGRNPMVRTVWIVANESAVPRLITAYPV